MPGRKVQFLVAAVVSTLLGVSAAAAGGYGYGYGQGCGCAPVVWGCGSSCGTGLLPSIIYGTGGCCAQPVYRVNQGPVYEPPRLTYGTAGYEGEPEYDYPYVGSGYGYPGYYPYGYPGYRPLGVPGYRPFGVRRHHTFRHGFVHPHMRPMMHRRFVGHRPMMPVHRRPMMPRRHW